MSHLLHESVTHDKLDVLPLYVSLLDSVTSSSQQLRARELLLVTAFYDELKALAPQQHIGLVHAQFLTQLQSSVDQSVTMWTRSKSISSSIFH